jgi:D-glycero-alpha-D-manno-heptose-7-phosphate kinase
MIISRTPLRISYIGGGSDMSQWWRDQGQPGAVISTAITKYIYIMVNARFDSKVRASYSCTEIVDDASQLRHELIREALGSVGIRHGIEVVSVADLPSGLGLGSSSSYTVGLFKALWAHMGKTKVRPVELAWSACDVEIDRCGKPIGKQDQYIAAYGGFRYFRFMPDGTVKTTIIRMTSETRCSVRDYTLLLYLGGGGNRSVILNDQGERLQSGETAKIMTDMVTLTDYAKDCLEGGNIKEFGQALNVGWFLKRKLATGISNPDIDDLYLTAIRHGALGGKVLGAGGAGFMMIFAPPHTHAAIIEHTKCDAMPVQIQASGSLLNRGMYWR